VDWERPNGHPRSLVVVALAKSRVIGFAWTVGGSESTAHVKEVAVLEAYQGRGIGPRLVRTAGEWMAELGHDSVSILPITGSGAWVTAHEFQPLFGAYWARIVDIT
jgi:GNAT superfamily N-acetyltransferase